MGQQAADPTQPHCEVIPQKKKIFFSLFIGHRAGKGQGGWALIPTHLPSIPSLSSPSPSPAPSPLLGPDKPACGKNVVTHISLPARGSR